MPSSARLHARGDFEADPDADHVILHARWDGRRFTLANGEPLPMLLPGALVRLRTATANLAQADVRRAATLSRRLSLLPAGQPLLALVDLAGLTALGLGEDGMLPGEPALTHDWHLARTLRRAYRETPHDSLAARDGLVPLTLLEPLQLVRRGDKPWRLAPCACRIDVLDTPVHEARSLNQALQWLSMRFERHRATHTANAFRRLLVPLEPLPDHPDAEQPHPVMRLEALRAAVSLPDEGPATAC